MVQARHRRRRARLPAARVQGRRQALRAVRPDRRRAPLRRRRDAHAAPPGRRRLRARPRAGCARRCARSPRSWWCCTRSASTPAGYAFAPDTPWQQRDGGRLPLRRDARPAQGHRRREGRHGVRRTRWTAWCAATSASARPRWPSGPRSRPSRTASRWPCSCPPRCWPSSTSHTFSDRFAGYPVRVEVLSPLPHAGQAKRGGRRASRSGEVDVRDRHPPPAVRGRRRSRTSACSWSTRSSASACSTRRRSRSSRPTSTCSR